MSEEQAKKNTPADQAIHEVICLINHHIETMRDSGQEDSVYRLQNVLYELLRERMEIRKYE